MADPLLLIRSKVNDCPRLSRKSDLRGLFIGGSEIDDGKFLLVSFNLQDFRGPQAI